MSVFCPIDFKKMQDFFYKKFPVEYGFRKQQLLALKNGIALYEDALIAALAKDLYKSTEEAYGTEIGFLYAEINHILKHLKNWMRPQKVSGPLMIFPSGGKIVRDPLGVVLIIAPWNYPVQLTLAPLAGAIAGGNCAVVKPSEAAPATAKVLRELIQATFASEYISLVEGDGAELVPQLIKQHSFNHIFFTGSTETGKKIAVQAASKLIPVTLELGGKTPCIVDKDVDLAIAAKRITWGKFTNAGQSCVAPDYLLVHADRKEELIQLIEKNIEAFYGKRVFLSEDYGRIINARRFDHLVDFLQQGNIITGGETDRENLYIAPTVMDGVSLSAPVMQEEIFGPILPVFSYSKEEEALSIIGDRSHPLALYLFTNNEMTEKTFMEQIPFGGGCINNSLVHLANSNLPFGGTGNSGMGNYHGKFSYETFTRPKSILKTGTWFDPSFKYPPYKGKLNYLKWLMK